MLLDSTPLTLSSIKIKLRCTAAALCVPASGPAPRDTSATAAALLTVDLTSLHRPDTRARTVTGFTALMLATKRGHARVVRLLLKAGADVQAQSAGSSAEGSSPGTTALHIAAENGPLNIVSLLLQVRWRCGLFKGGVCTCRLQHAAHSMLCAALEWC